MSAEDYEALLDLLAEVIAEVVAKYDEKENLGQAPGCEKNPYE